MYVEQEKEQRLDTLIDLVNRNIKVLMDNKRHKFEMINNTLKLVNPLNILDNGYSVVKYNNEVLKSTKNISIGDEVSTRLHDGEFISIVKEIK